MTENEIELLQIAKLFIDFLDNKIGISDDEFEEIKQVVQKIESQEKE